MILRSLLNLLAVTRWITLDSGKRAARYLHWYWVAMHSEAERFQDRVPPELASVIEKSYGRIKRQFECKDSKGKTRLVSRRYQPEVKTIQEMFVKTGLEKQYETT